MTDRLWAPWRCKYVTRKKPKGCIFCKVTMRRKKDYLLFKTCHSVAMLNIFPYNNGHLMVAPIRHTAELNQLSDAEMLDLFKGIKRAKDLLSKALKPDGYNIGMNLSRASGAGIPEHLHIHIVPRWKADINFMPTICDTTVLCLSLDKLYKKLKDADTK